MCPEPGNMLERDGISAMCRQISAMCIGCFIVVYFGCFVIIRGKIVIIFFKIYFQSRRATCLFLFGKDYF